MKQYKPSKYNQITVKGRVLPMVVKDVYESIISSLSVHPADLITNRDEISNIVKGANTLDIVIRTGADLNNTVALSGRYRSVIVVNDIAVCVNFTPSHACTIHRFKKLVEEMETNFGECCPEIVSAYKHSDKELLKPKIKATKNKTIFDAVNELHGEVLDSNVMHIVIERSAGHIILCGRPDLDVLNSPTWKHLCSIERFNALVDAMSTNFGESFTYHDYKVNFKGITTDRLMPIMQASSTYTQEMADSGVLPIGTIVGVEGLERRILLGPDSDGDYITKDKDGAFDFHGINDFSPPTPPVPLVDGKAYQFDLVDGTVCGIFRSMNNRFYNVDGDVCTKNCTNIQPLTLKEK